jgi:UDP-N-acetylglucosamine 2-epimerase (non-hydrolysing)
MKVAPIIKAARAHNAQSRNGDCQFDCHLVHTGQHYDQKMSDVFFQELSIPAPDFNLGVGSGSHAVQTAQIMTAFEPVLLTAFGNPQPSTINPQPCRPDWVVVVGDVNSTMACTLVCSKLGIKVAHVEAGLRSFDRTMPEEVNRIVTDALADLLLTPSADADENLKREGIPADKISLVGNVMIDTLIANLAKVRQNPILQELGLAKKSFAYVTLHRPSNVDYRESLSAIISELKSLAAKLPVVFPIHPRTRQRLTDFGLAPSLHHPTTPSLRFLDPIGYLDSLALTRAARLVLTDSGGLQEESTFFRTPCLTLRPNTERPVTVTLGSNRLTDAQRLSEDIDKVLSGAVETGQVPPLWDGKAAERIIQALAQHG